MKTYLTLLAAAAFAAGTAFAQEEIENTPAPAPAPALAPAPAPGPQPAWNPGGGQSGWNHRAGPPAGPMSPEMMQQMRAEHQAIRELGEAARAETNETQKAELVAQLRVKLGEVADRMQKQQEERLAQAEERLAGLKDRIGYSKANRDQLLDEQVQRILSGEKPRRPEAFDKFPHAKGGQPGDEGEPGAKRHGNRNRSWDKRGHGMGPCEGMTPPPPPAEEGAEMAPPPAGDEGMAPPPPADDMPGDMPPPEENDLDPPPPEE